MDPVNVQARPADLMTPASALGLPAVMAGLDLQQLRSRLGREDNVMQAVLR